MKAPIKKSILSMDVTYWLTQDFCTRPLVVLIVLINNFNICLHSINCEKTDVCVCVLLIDRVTLLLGMILHYLEL